MEKLLNYINENIEYNSAMGTLTWKYTRGRMVQGSEIGNITSLGYRRTTVMGRPYLVHHLIWLLETGALPTDCLDHINHNKTDNRFINLRPVSRQENQKNLQKKASNTSGVTGVSWDPVRNKWHQRIQVKGRAIHLGYHSTIAQAAKARKQAEIEYGFHENHGL